MTNNVFMVRNVFCSHKDYISFLGVRLTVFNLCNYAGEGKPCDFFGLFWLIFLFMKLILLVVNSCRTIRVVYAYFVGHSLFYCL
jgi:hypothetical protein